MRVTVIVPCKGHADSLVRCLRSISRQTPHFSFETIVVDSANDPTVLAAAQRFPGVRVIRGNGNLRAGSARNLAARESQARYLAFIDADCQAERSWLETAVEALADGPLLVGGPVLHALPWHPVAVADNVLQFAELGPRRPTGPARNFPACNMVVSREAFLAVGGFPEVESTAGEDTALCIRIRERWPDSLRFVQGMRVRHEGRTTIGDLLRHHAHFGYTRGALGLTISAAQRRQGASLLAVPAVVARRLGYITSRVVQWDPGGVPRFVLLSPLLVSGLCAWALAFRRGCREQRKVLT